MSALLERTHGPDAKPFLIELNNRFAFPAACLVLMLVGVPLGVTSRRGGKSSGFVYTILLVFLYYFLSSIGTALGKQNKIPAFARRLVGKHPLCRRRHLPALANGKWRHAFWPPSPPGSRAIQSPHQMTLATATVSPSPAFSTGFSAVLSAPKSRNAFPRILDEYVVREFLGMFLPRAHRLRHAHAGLHLL